MFLVHRFPQWVPILVAGILYGVAFTLPAVALEWQFNNNPPFLGKPISGEAAFKWALSFRASIWLANPLFWLAAFFLAWRLWPWAAALAIAATTVAFLEVIRKYTHQTGSEVHVGYWLWTGSMAVLAALALLGWMRFVPRDRRRSLREVFSGWRGVSITSWLVTGVAVLGVAWFWDELERSGNSGNSNEPVISETQTVAGVIFNLERLGSSGYSGFHGGDALSYQIGTNTIEFRSGDLTLNGIDHGDLKAGDTVRLAPDGKLFVNGSPRGPYPTPTKWVDPPSIPLSTGNAGVFALAWVSPVRLIAITSDQKVRGWDLPNREPRFTWPTRDIPKHLAVSPDGTRIAVSTQRGTLVWTKFEEPPVKIPGREGSLHGIAFFDNEHLIEARGKEVSLRRLGKDDELPVPFASIRSDMGWYFAASRDGRFTACSQENETLAITRLIGQSGVPTPVPGLAIEGSGFNATPAFNRDGSRLFVYRDGIGHSSLSRGALIIDTLNGAPVSRLRWPHTAGMGGQIRSVAFSPDSTLLAIGELEAVRVYEVASGRERVWYGSPRLVNGMLNPEGEGWCEGIAFSSDGKYLAAGFRDGKGPKLRIWETATFLNAPEK